MKNTITLALVSIFSISFIFGQSQYVQKTLNTSKLSHTFLNVGFLQNSIDDADYYSLDGNSIGFNSGFSTGLIITSTDPNGIVSTPFHTYEPQNQFVPGILTENGNPMSENEVHFNRIWSISSEEISLIKKLYSENQLTLDDLPKDVVEWPAKGNPYFEYNVSSRLAPFYDHDSDNEYDPLMGDLPIPIAENENFTASKFTFCVYHTLGSNSLEISQITYTLDCSESDLQSSVFTRLKVTNKGIDELREIKLGLFKDVDLGCIDDDYVGSHPETNSIYSYNKEWIDDDFCFGGLLPIPAHSTAIYSTIFLSHPMHSCVPVDYLSGQFPSPELPFQYHNVLNGNFADGTPMTYGGYGFNPASADEAKFVFPTLPSDDGGWHMNNINEPEIIDLKLIPSIDLNSLAVGASKTVDLVDVVFTFDYTDSSIFDEYESRVSDLIEQNNMALNLATDCHSFSHCEEDCLWPGDINGNGRVEADDAVLLVGLLDNETPNALMRSRISADWLGFESESWQGEEAGIDLKYGDVNGNGEMNRRDLSLLIDNLKLENDTYEKQSDIFPPLDPEGIAIELQSDEISATGNLFDSSARGPITLGDEIGNISKSIVAISFDMLIDTSLVFFNPFFYVTSNTFAFDSNENYFENVNDPFETEGIGIKYSSRYSHVMYNFDEAIEEGGTILSSIGITARTTAKTKNENGQEYTKIEIANVVAIDKDGNKLDVGIRYKDSVLITDLIYDPNLAVDNEKSEELNVSVSPNPVSNVLHINLNQREKGVLMVRNLEGRLIYSNSYDTQSFDINTELWDAGVYILSFNSDNNSISKKVIKF